jgi:hypothetical protein
VKSDDGVTALLAELGALGNAKDRAGMARYGINVENAFGVSVRELRRIAKRTGVDRRLAGRSPGAREGKRRAGERSVGRASSGEGSPKVSEWRSRRSSPAAITEGVAAAVALSEPRRRWAMRVMVIVKATKNSEAGILPGDPRAPPGYERLFQEMGRFNEELVRAGVMLAGEGLQPSSKGKRVFLSCGGRTVVDGPFPDFDELVAGFWLWEVGSMEEAVEWVKRCPDPMPGEESVIEVRPLMEADDLGKEFTPALRAQEEHLREEVQRQHRS